MKQRQLAILAGITVVVGAAAAVSAYQRAAATLGTVASELLFPGLIDRVNDVATIEVKGADGTVVIQRKGEGWVMPDRGDFAVRFELVKQNLVTMAELKTVEPKTAKPDLHGRVEVEAVTEPKAKSKHMTLKDGDGKTIAEAVIGKKRYAPIGGKDMVYVRKAAESRVWLAEGVFDVRWPAPEWLVKEISGLPEKRWRHIVITQPDGEKAELGRKDTEQQNYDVLNSPDGRKAMPPGQVNSVASAFDFLNLDDVKPAKDLGETSPGATAEFKAFDGLVVRSKMLAKDGTNWTVFEAAIGETADGAPIADSVKEEADKLNAKWSGWAYRLPEYKQNFLSRKIEDLIEPRPKEERKDDESKTSG
jgi:hypothetical protein